MGTLLVSEWNFVAQARVKITFQVHALTSVRGRPGDAKMAITRSQANKPLAVSHTSMDLEKPRLRRLESCVVPACSSVLLLGQAGCLHKLAKFQTGSTQHPQNTGWPGASEF